MNRRQAKAYVLRVLAAEARHHLGNGSEWLERPLRRDSVAVLEDGTFSEADQERVAEAVREVASELDRRWQRLERKRIVRRDRLSGM